MDSEGWGGGEVLGGVEGAESVVSKYYIRKKSIFMKGKKEKFKTCYFNFLWFAMWIFST